MDTGSKGTSATASDAVRLYQQGVAALEEQQVERAIRCFKDAVEADRRACYLSHLALCLAQYQGEYYASVLLCQEAVKKDPKNQLHFLRLGKVQILAGRKKEAIRILTLGLRLGKNQEIEATLRSLGVRQKPVIPFLSRTNPLNKYLGKLRSSLGKGRP